MHLIHMKWFYMTGNRLGATVQRTGEITRKKDIETPQRVQGSRSKNTHKSNSRINS